jgi:hypothetical protein
MKATLGESHPTTLTTQFNLALLFHDHGKFDRAEPLYLECLEKRKKILGETHPDTVVTSNNLTALYQYQSNKPVEAETSDPADLMFLLEAGFIAPSVEKATMNFLVDLDVSPDL